MPRLLFDSVTRIDCTTLARVKSIMGWTDSDATRDALVETIIDAVSERIEAYIGSPLTNAQRTEEYDLRPRQAVIFLRVVPVTSIYSVTVAEDWVFNLSTPIDSSLYRVNQYTGELWLRTELAEARTDGLWQDHPLGCQIVYTAGFATDTATLLSSYPAIGLAADLWVCEIFRRKSEVMGTTKRIGDSSSSRTDELRMPKEVSEALSQYRRIRFGMA